MDETLRDVYALIADLWCSPPATDAERREIREDAKRVVERLEGIDGEGAMLLSRFLKEDTISEEDYIDLFELEPRCPLYLGSHSYDEPKTCANAAVSNRNEYMIELVGIYRHFGQALNGKELPDYLPLIVDFLSLTVGSKDDPVREKLIDEYVVPFLSPMRSRLEELQTPYLHLLAALERVMTVDTEMQPSPRRPKQREECGYVG